MDPRAIKLSLLVSLIGMSAFLSSSTLRPVRGATADVPLVSVWSDLCRSSNITTTNSGCGPLITGGSFQVEINVTNAPAFNAYQFFLYYDSNYVSASSFDLTTGTVFGNGNPSNLVANPLSPPGTVHLAVANIFNPPSYTGSNGTLAHITFNILKIGVSPLVLSAAIASAGGGTMGGTVLVSNTTPILVATSNGYFSLEPVKRVKFVDSPAAPAPNSLGTWSPGKVLSSMRTTAARILWATLSTGRPHRLGRTLALITRSSS